MATVSGVPGTMPQTKSSSSWLIYLLVLLVLGAIVYGVYVFVKGNPAKDSDNGNVKVTDLTGEEETNTEEETPDTTEEEPTEETPEEDTTDFSLYSTEQQTTGSSSNESEYTLTEITDSKQTGFHRFVFTIEAKGGATEVPYVVATYKTSLGAIRIDLNGVTTDSSGIGYQKSRTINEQGIIRLYHNVSSDQTEELYDVGISSSTPFYLTSAAVPTFVEGDQMWTVTLDVKYPGESEIESDFGSTEFSSNPQSITGANKVDGAKVSAYSYNSASGILSIVFTVSGSSTKPIPSATAGYDGSMLTLRFTSIVSDTIAKMPAALDLPGGITMVWEMEDSDTSIYTFDGADGDFRLSGTTNPNQVTLEIKL